MKKTHGCLGSIKSLFARAQAPVRATQTALSTLVTVSRQPQMEMPMVMVRFPSATLVRTGRENVRDMPGEGDPSMRDFVRQSGPVIVGVDSDENMETELRDYLVAMASGETARLPARPDLGFRYRVKALPPTNVRMSIMPPTTAAKSTAEPKAQNLPMVEQITGRRPLSAPESFRFLEIQHANSGTHSTHSATPSVAHSSDDSDGGDYEYSTVIQDCLKKECQNAPAPYQPAAAPQARQVGQRMALSTSSTEGDDECNQSTVLRAREDALRLLLSDASIADEDDRRMSLSCSSSGDESDDEGVPMACPAAHRWVLSIGSDFLSSSSVEGKADEEAAIMAHPASRHRALSIDSGSSLVGSAASIRRSNAHCLPAVERSRSAWVDLNPECTAMHFASPSEGCMARFICLWDDECAEPIDQSLFADFDEVPADNSSDSSSDSSSDGRRGSWSTGDETMSYGHSIQTSVTSTYSRRNSWSAGDEIGYQDILVPGRGDPARLNRFVSLPVEGIPQTDIMQQNQERPKGNGRP